MQDVFNYRDEVIKEYQSFSRSFTNISAPDIKAVVDAEYEEMAEKAKADGKKTCRM